MDNKENEVLFDADNNEEVCTITEEDQKDIHNELIRRLGDTNLSMLMNDNCNRFVHSIMEELLQIPTNTTSENTIAKNAACVFITMKVCLQKLGIDDDQLDKEIGILYWKYKKLIEDTKQK